MKYLNYIKIISNNKMDISCGIWYLEPLTNKVTFTQTQEMWLDANDWECKEEIESKIINPCPLTPQQINSLKNPPVVYYQALIKEGLIPLNHQIINSENQKIEFYEHPLLGDSHPVIAICHILEQAYDSDFFDTEDFYEGSKYNPVILDEEIIPEFEF